MNTKSIFLLCMWLFATCFLQAQDKMPQAVSYQAVARDAQGKVVAQKPIGIQVEILKGSTTGTVVFSETHTPTSSNTGTVNLLIGQGTRKTGSFSSVDWGADTYYLQLSMDLNGGSNYEKVSTTQMLPVPYALYAAKAGTVENGTGETSNNSVDFVLIPTDNRPERFYNLIAGKDLETSYPGFIEVYFSIIYLNGLDQELDAILEGIPENVSQENGNFPSTSIGRLFKISTEKLPKGEYNLVLVIKKKDGTVLKEYPFVFKSSPID